MHVFAIGFCRLEVLISFDWSILNIEIFLSCNFCCYGLYMCVFFLQLGYTRKDDGVSTLYFTSPLEFENLKLSSQSTGCIYGMLYRESNSATLMFCTILVLNSIEAKVPYLAFLGRGKKTLFTCRIPLFKKWTEPHHMCFAIDAFGFNLKLLIFLLRTSLLGWYIFLPKSCMILWTKCILFVGMMKWKRQ